MTAMLMFEASKMSISAVGSGTMMTSTLPIIPTGRIRSRMRPKGKAESRAMAP